MCDLLSDYNKSDLVFLCYYEYGSFTQSGWLFQNAETIQGGASPQCGGGVYNWYVIDLDIGHCSKFQNTKNVTKITDTLIWILFSEQEITESNKVI